MTKQEKQALKRAIDYLLGAQEVAPGRYAIKSPATELNIIVRRQLDGYYWRVNSGDLTYGPLYNTASSEAEARKQAQEFIKAELT